MYKDEKTLHESFEHFGQGFKYYEIILPSLLFTFNDYWDKQTSIESDKIKILMK